MKMRKITEQIRTAMTAVALCLLFSACSSDQLPVGSSLRITPEDRNIRIVELRDEDDVCIFFSNNYVDVPVVITLVNAQQSPIGGAEISVYLDFAENTFTGVPALKLYRDGNGNGVIDDESEYVSGINDPIAKVRTRDLSGDSNLLLRINLSCEFRGEVFAYVDGTTASATINVEAINGPSSTGE